MRKWKSVLSVALGIQLASFALNIFDGPFGFSSGHFSGLASSSGIASAPVMGSMSALQEVSRAFNQIAARATPAVVSISSVRMEGPLTQLGESSPEFPSVGIGAGVIIRSDGIILTNDHVVQNSSRMMVTLEEKKKVPAHLVGRDPKTDLAVIQLDRPPVQPLPTLGFGDSDQIAVGDWILAVGSPFGLPRSVTSGIVSAKGRASLGMLDTEDFIQTDAAINPGNSGGPLLNIKGEMVGINTAIYSQSGGFVGIGFAIPSKIASQVFTEIMAHGRVIRGWMGVTTQDLDSDLAQYFKVQPERGALISNIAPNSPADRASLVAGDVILAFDHVQVESAGHLKSLVTQILSPRNVVIGISHNGKFESRVAFIREQPQMQLPGQVAKKEEVPLNLGLDVQDIPPEFSSIFGLSSGRGAIVTGIKPGSPAYDAGISRGDIILTVNKVEIRHAHELMDFVRKHRQAHSGESIVLYVQKGPDERVFVPIHTVAGKGR